MFLELNENEIEIIERTLAMKIIETNTNDKTLLPILKKIRKQMDNGEE